MDDSWDSIYMVEKDLNKSLQYNRRECIEIGGLPDDIPNKLIEPTVVNILRKLGLHDLQYYEIAACHKLKNYKYNSDSPANVIIRFTNRKRALQCLLNKRFLKERVPYVENLYISESLCPKYRELFDECYKLKNECKIMYLWTFNGIINFKLSDRINEKAKRILHENDLEFYFPRYNG